MKNGWHVSLLRVEIRGSDSLPMRLNCDGLIIDQMVAIDHIAHVLRQVPEGRHRVACRDVVFGGVPGGEDVGRFNIQMLGDSRSARQATKHVRLWKERVNSRRTHDKKS